MKAIHLLINLAVATAFAPPVKVGLSIATVRNAPSTSTAVFGLGDRLRSLVRRESKDDVAVMEKEAMDVSVKNVGDDEVVETSETVTPAALEKEKSETEKLMQKVKDAGVAGVISYALWELGFWTISVPVCVFGYRELTGHWPDFSNQEDLEKVGAEAFAFVNFARFAVPLRIGLALSTTPWIQANIVDRYMNKDDIQDETQTSNGPE